LEDGIAQEEFKRALSAWPSGVTVVATRDEHGVYGLTASSFSSVSLKLPLVLVCLATTNQLASMIERSGHFTVSVLAEHQREVSDELAVSGRMPSDRLGNFEEVGLSTGSPGVLDAAVVLDCRVHELVAAGDHQVLIGRAVATESRQGCQPLVYLDRAYRRIC
jgi:flavin reductase (DIM6/NTAB) family NADH-FMN oxidoreductase RutF